ncbi:MAG: (Fe-S)-binding protein [Flavobacteriales bacterium]|nr:(Fe-S)-binding protein [Flavobacteriales bacterium]
MDTSAHFTIWKGTAKRTNSTESLTSLKKILDCAHISYGEAENEYDVADELRSMGDEYTFESIARKNISALNDAGITHIITPCAHSYTVFTKYYPDFGGHFKVYHHTDFILELLKSGRLNIVKNLSGQKISYHDPCRLSRIGKTEPSREIIKTLGGIVCEAKHHGKMSMCCGGGGSLTVSDVPSRIAQMRIMELEATGAEKIITTCPICRDMLCANSFSQSPKVEDIATLVASCL